MPAVLSFALAAWGASAPLLLRAVCSCRAFGAKVPASAHHPLQAFLYVSAAKKVVGLAILEPIRLPSGWRPTQVGHGG